MNKAKFILGIFITILGGAVMLISMVFGIIHFAGSLYRNVQILDIDLKTFNVVQKTTIFELKKGQIISAWLKYPNRRLENENFNIYIHFVDKNEVIPGKLGASFSSGYFRNSAGQGQYYWLGEHDFNKNFNGCIQYKTTGSYLPTETGKLVLRQSLPFSLPVKHLLFFMAGIFILIIGIGTIVKNSSGK